MGARLAPAGLSSAQIAEILDLSRRRPLRNLPTDDYVASPHLCVVSLTLRIYKHRYAGITD